MVRNGVFVQAYNAQAAVSEDQIIVAHGITNDPVDALQLAPMLERVRANCGEHPKIVTADSGYARWRARHACDDRVLDMSQKIACGIGKKIYALRKILVEPVFGQIKGAMDFRRFMLRGLSKVPSEWGIVCTCHNLLKLFRPTARDGVGGLHLATRASWRVQIEIDSTSRGTRPAALVHNVSA